MSRLFTKGALGYGATHRSSKKERTEDIAKRLETLDENEKRTAIMLMREMQHPQTEEVVARLYEFV